MPPVQVFGRPTPGLLIPVAEDVHIREYAAAIPDRRLTLKRIIADGDLIAFETGFTGTSSGAVPTLPPAGEAVTAAFCTVLHLRDGKIASQDDYIG